MPDGLYPLLIVLAIFGGIIVVGYIMVHFFGKVFLALLIEKGVEITLEHGPPTLRKIGSAMWRKIYPRLPKWAQRVLPTPTASTPRTSGQVHGGHPVALNNPPTGPAGAPTPAVAPANPSTTSWKEVLTSLLGFLAGATFLILGAILVFVSSLTPAPRVLLVLLVIAGGLSIGLTAHLLSMMLNLRKRVEQLEQTQTP